MSSERFNRGLLKFLQQSPTPFHAVANLGALLEDAGFRRLNEADAWKLKKQGRYYVVRNDSSLVAFKIGTGELVEAGIRIAGTHTDSPGLKLKPEPELRRQGYMQLGVEVYGGALYSPWFDRDLSIAGRVHYQLSSGEVSSRLIDFAAPIAFIPSLAIHLDREVNQGRPINAQKELPPLLLQLDDEDDDFSFEDCLRQQLDTDAAEVSAILAHELFLYDTQAPALVGLQKQFIASARLDNLLSTYLALQSLLASSDDHASVLVCNDHEEVGSASTSGAQGPFLRKVLERWVEASESGVAAMERVIHRSVLFSIDNAHGVHPNFSEKHDEQHKPLLNKGPVIKINANQRYASNSETVALFKALCKRVKVPYQSFVMRSDLACGSTIGPLTATELGIATLDIGVPQFAMHSIRELAGAEDAVALAKVVTAFYDR